MKEQLLSEELTQKEEEMNHLLDMTNKIRKDDEEKMLNLSEEELKLFLETKNASAAKLSKKLGLKVVK